MASGESVAENHHILSILVQCTVLLADCLGTLPYTYFTDVIFCHMQIYDTTNPPLVLFPTVVIPLNSSTCMCSSLKEIARDLYLQFDLHNSSIVYSAGCDVADPCGTTVLCYTSPNFFNATLTIHVCDDPPSVEILVMSADGTALDHVFDETADAPINLFGLNATLSVNLTQLNYSLTLAVRIPMIRIRIPGFN